MAKTVTSYKNVGRGQFKIILEVSRKNDETLKKGGVKML